MAVNVPLKQYCWLHHCVCGLQLNEHIVLGATKCFLSSAQEPAGAVIPLAEATVETIDGNATAAASTAIFANLVMISPELAPRRTILP